MQEWHNRMGHVARDALQHLEAQIQGVAVTDAAYDIVCEVIMPHLKSQTYCLPDTPYESNNPVREDLL